jgi:hypothetical protein
MAGSIFKVFNVPGLKASRSLTPHQNLSSSHSGCTDFRPLVIPATKD